MYNVEEVSPLRRFARIIGSATVPRGGGLAGARSWLDAFDQDSSGTRVAGWLVGLDHSIDRVRVRVNGELLGEADLETRPDIAAAFPIIPHAIRSGVAVSGSPTISERPSMVEFFGLADGMEVVRAEHYWPDDRFPALETPTDNLMQRVGGNNNKIAFRRSGFNLAAQLLAPVQTYREAAGLPRVLDWGCGPGRATQFLQSLWPGIELSGCDIDAEAIDWCVAHIPGIRFDATNPFPPLPYEDEAFDAVISSSVMTHLGASVQLLWLDEICRVLAPDGIFVTTVHGPFAARVAGEAPLLSELKQHGIVDRTVDAALDGIAPANYYRATWQTVEYTLKNWSRDFAILEYREAGLDNFQDLVVKKRRRPSRRWFGWLR